MDMQPVRISVWLLNGASSKGIYIPLLFFFYSKSKKGEKKKKICAKVIFLLRMFYCQGDWIEAQLYCFTGGFEDCESTLNMLYDCASEVTLPPVPTDW